MNAAFLESNKLGDFNCFIFHDVDMLPEVGELLYSCDKQPIHLSPAVSKFYYNLNYGTDFGGVVAISKAQFQHVNGYRLVSNIDILVKGHYSFSYQTVTIKQLHFR